MTGTPTAWLRQGGGSDLSFSGAPKAMGRDAGEAGCYGALWPPTKAGITFLKIG